MCEIFHTSPVVNDLWRVISLNLTFPIKIDCHDLLSNIRYPDSIGMVAKGIGLTEKTSVKKFV